MNDFKCGSRFNNYGLTGLSVSVLALSLSSLAYADQSMTSAMNKKNFSISSTQNQDIRKVTYAFNGLSQNTIQKTEKSESESVQPVFEASHENRGFKDTQNESIETRLFREIELLKQQNTALQEQVKQLSIQVNALEQHKKHVQLKNSNNSKPSVLLQTELSQREPANKIEGELDNQHEAEVQPGIRQEPLPESKAVQAMHHVVYIFKSKDDQLNMWNKLSEAGQQDRWQGHNSDASRYFIYVGAYEYKEDAVARSEFLSQELAVKPLVYTTAS